MRVRQIVVVGSASLALAFLPCRFAWADNTNQSPSNSATSNQGQATQHLNLYNFALPRLDDKPVTGFAHGNNEPGSLQNKSVEQAAPSSGLHWTTIDSHPGVGYKIDKNEDVRLHFGGHGAVASYALHF